MAAVDQVLLKPTQAPKKFNALRRRKTKINRNTTSWVERNIMKKTRNSEDGDFTEVPTDCYGEIDFIGAARKAKAKFVRFSDTTSPAVIYDLMTKQWRLGRPRLVISVSGSSTYFDVDPKLKPIFQAGLQKVARTPGAWVICHGIHAGVTKHVGEALQGAAKACIGISSFGVVTNRHHLVSTDPKTDLGGKFPYRISCSLLGNRSFLDHNHTHHLMVDDGSDKDESSIQFRCTFEKYIMECAVGKIPAVLLVLQGCVDTIDIVWTRICDDSPISIVVVKDSGKAADLISYALDITEGAIKDVESSNAKILEMTGKLFPELSEEEQKIICEKIVFCVEKREFFTVYRVEGNAGIDEAILKSLLSGKKISQMEQLQFTLLWDRADLARENILSKLCTWQQNELEVAMIMSLAMDRVDFVKLLLEHGISIELLTNDVMEFLYGYQSRSSTSTLNFEIDAEEYVPAKVNKYQKVVDILCSFEGINPLKCAIPRKTILYIVRYLCRNLIGNRKQEFLEKLNVKSEDEEVQFAYPFRELFFWAVLNNKQKMATYLWQFEEEAMSKALIAAEINNVLCKLAQKRDLQDDIVKSFIENEKQFRSLALGLLDECYKTNESKTVQLITCEFYQFADQTCLGLAVDTEDLDYVSHNAVQLLLSEVWTGTIKAREVTDFQIFSAFVFPPLINNIPFYPDSAFKELSFVNTEELQHEVDMVDGATTGDSELDFLSRQNSIKHTEVKYLSCNSVRSKQPFIPFYKKCYQFYLKTPVIKFYANVFWFLVFLVLFAYVSMIKVGKELMEHEYFLFVYVVSLTLAEINEVIMGEGHTMKIKIKQWLHSQWDNLDAICIIFFYITFAVRLHDEKLEVANVMYAINGGFWVMRLLQVFFVHRILGPYVVMVFRMAKDLLNFMVILFVFLISYGVTAKAILNPEPRSVALHKLVKDVIFHPYFNIYGELFNNDPPDNSTTSFGTPVISSYAEPIAWFLLGMYLLISNVLLMNILIAAFNNTFNDVQENAAQIWKFQRHGLVLEYAQRVQLPPPFSLIIHVLLLSRWFLQKCGVWKWKIGGNTMLKAGVSCETKNELIEFENKCMTAFIRKREATSCKSREKTTAEILKYVDGVNTAISGIGTRLKEIEANLQNLIVNDEPNT